ncbi:cation:proton antiporter [Nocardia harenae]|uniref:cation:proton antiporter n=1 Tax=Nocardia harenae TaxID=358707 RepID=UPI0009FCAC71|nr:cation:proton antiporter [Nocardia harenae]
MPSLFDLSTHFFLQLAVLLVVCRLVWPVFRWLGQIRVVAIMGAGFLLGPSVLGALWPAGQQWLFPVAVDTAAGRTTHPSLAILYVVGQLGLVLYMFLVGAGFRTEIFAAHFRVAGVTAAAGLVVPMLLGGAAGLALIRGDGWFADGVATWQAVLFTAAAVAITAFPMLAWMIDECGLAETRVGTMALACAATDDAVAWILLAAVVAGSAGSMDGAVVAGIGTALFVGFMLTAGRRLLRRLGGPAAADPAQPIAPALLVVLVVLLCSAWITDLIGVHAVFGAFVAGLAMPRGPLLDMLRARTEPLVSGLLLPAFFVFAGLNTDLGLLLVHGALLVTAVVLVLSFGGKFGAVTLAARYQGLSWPEAGALGAFANARGLTELVLLTIGLTQGIITPALYTVFAVMAFATTLATTPLYRAFERRAGAGGLRFGADGALGVAVPGPGSADVGRRTGSVAQQEIAGLRTVTPSGEPGIHPVCPDEFDGR